MDKVINLGIPHVGELIFERIDTPGMFQCALVSETWKVLAENVLIKRWKGKILEACKNGETKVVQLLMKHFNSEESGLNIKDEEGRSAFMWGCYFGHKDIVILLLDLSDSIELNAKDNNGGCTAFILACYNGQKDVVKLLLDHSERIDLNARTNNGGFTGLMLACTTGDKDVVQLLLNHSNSRIEVNATNNDDWTAFRIACLYGHKNIVQLLLEYSDIDISGCDLHQEMIYFFELYQRKH